MVLFNSLENNVYYSENWPSSQCLRNMKNNHNHNFGFFNNFLFLLLKVSRFFACLTPFTSVLCSLYFRSTNIEYSYKFLRPEQLLPVHRISEVVGKGFPFSCFIHIASSQNDVINVQTPSQSLNLVWSFAFPVIQ